MAIDANGERPAHSTASIQEFWGRRSWKGKTALVLGSLFLLLAVIGYAAPPEQEASRDTATVTAGEEESEQVGETTTADAETTTDATTSGAETTTAEAAQPPPPLHVSRVIDGDTLELDNGDTIRLVQVDAPAWQSCYGRKALRVLRQLLPVGMKVRVVRDRSLDDTDGGGRLLRYVFKGKKHINLSLVEKGAASAWFFQGDRGRHASKLLAAATRAEANGNGAWGACQATLDPVKRFRTRAKPAPPPPVEPQPVAGNCHPSYKGACLNPGASDLRLRGR